MTTPLQSAPRPCSTCPYRRDTPRGLWAASEYRKLAAYDENPGPLAVFHCHAENATGIDTVCRGWLAVHPDCIAVRLALSRGALTPEQRDAPVDVALYTNGAEAARAGLRGVRRPGPAARRAIDRLLRRRMGA